MRKVILQDFVTVDGYAADSSGGMDFIQDYGSRNDRSFQEDAEKFLDRVDTMLLGANTYKLFVDYWPASTKEGMFADKLNSLNKVVVSTSLSEAPWGKWEPAQIISDRPPENIKALKRKEGKDIVLWGSFTLARSLMSENLIDEYQLRICPVLLGNGKKPFSESLPLKLQHVKTYDKGMVLLHYQQDT